MMQDAVADGVYSSLQADRGKGLYARECARCHGDLLDDGTAPPLSGPIFNREWDGKSLNAFFRTMRATMTGLGVSLSDQGFVDVIAYILRYNGYPPGNEDLLADSDLLAATSIRSHEPAEPITAVPFLRGGYAIVPHSASPMTWELEEAAMDTVNWLLPGYDYTGSRSVPSSQVNRNNSATLRMIKVAGLEGKGGDRTHPIVYENIMYVTTAYTTLAMDAATLEPIWRHNWDVLGAEEDLTEHGVALKGGRVLRVTPDGYLIALKMEDGGLLWARRIFDPGSGEKAATVPVSYRSMILVAGEAGHKDQSVWAGGFKVKNGESVWRFNGPEDRETTGADTTVDTINRLRGSFHLDMARDALYVVDSFDVVVALDARKGALLWYDKHPGLTDITSTATSGGVAFTTDASGRFVVTGLDPEDPIYRFSAYETLHNNVVTYRVAGKQYVATVSGMDTSAAIRIFTVAE